LISQLNSVNSYDNYHEFRWQLFNFTPPFIKAEINHKNKFILSINQTYIKRQML